MANETKELNVALIGDSGVGKSTLLNRLTTGEFEKKYTPTLEQTDVILRFTCKGADQKTFDLTMKVRDYGGQLKYSPPSPMFSENCDAAIVMFDVTNESTYQNVKFWTNKFFLEKPEAPTVVCGNKVDVKDRRVRPDSISGHQYYCDISAKSNYNFEKPFLAVVRKCLGDNKIVFCLPE